MYFSYQLCLKQFHHDISLRIPYISLFKNLNQDSVLTFEISWLYTNIRYEFKCAGHGIIPRFLVPPHQTSRSAVWKVVLFGHIRQCCAPAYLMSILSFRPFIPPLGLLRAGVHGNHITGNILRFSRFGVNITRALW